MTLIIGILCQDGVALGADGSATFDNSVGQLTAKQPTKKLFLIPGGKTMAVGVSGSVGISQQICDLFGKFYVDGLFAGKGGKLPTAPELARTIRDKIWDECLKREYEIAATAKDVIGVHRAQQSCICACLAVIPFTEKAASRPVLIIFDERGHPTLASEDLPCFAIGSGQTIADPFLAYLRHLFWPKGLPKLSEGIFAVCWTLAHAIRTNPMGLGEPKQIIVLENKSGSLEFRQFDEGEMALQEEAVTKVEKHLKDFQTPSAELPEIPKPDSGVQPKK